MRNRGSVGSFTESHRAVVLRPDRRIFIPQTGQLPSALRFSGGFSDCRSILTIQNAADLEFPATDPANAPPVPNSNWTASRRIITSRQQRRHRRQPRHRRNKNSKWPSATEAAFLYARSTLLEPRSLVKVSLLDTNGISTRQRLF
jgi:hypothetical protein